jgi:hypothetical protein
MARTAPSFTLRVPVGRPIGRPRVGNSKGLGFSGWDTTEAAHEALVVGPRHVVGGDGMSSTSDSMFGGP